MLMAWLRHRFALGFTREYRASNARGRAPSPTTSGRSSGMRTHSLELGRRTLSEWRNQSSVVRSERFDHAFDDVTAVRRSETARPLECLGNRSTRSTCPKRSSAPANRTAHSMNATHSSHLPPRREPRPRAPVGCRTRADG